MNDKRKTFGKNKNFVDDKMKRIKKALDLNNIYDKANIKNFKEKIIKIISLINYILYLIFNSFYFFSPNL